MQLEKREKMMQQEVYLDNIECFIKLCAQPVTIEQEGHCATVFEDPSLMEKHYAGFAQKLESLSTTISAKKADLVSELKNRCSSTRTILGVLQDPQLPTTADPNELQVEATKELNKQLARFKPWCSLHQTILKVVKGTRPVVLDVFKATEAEMARKVKASAKVWATEMHKFYDEIKALLFKRRQNLKIAQDDLAERKTTLEKRRERAAAMETVALELGAAQRLAAEEQDLRVAESNTKTMSGKLDLLEKRFAAIHSLAWPVLQQLSVTNNRPFGSMAPIVQLPEGTAGPDSLESEDFIQILVDLQSNEEEDDDDDDDDDDDGDDDGGVDPNA
jgi:hypothetical protein